MTTSEKILFSLKRAVLEYALKHRLDSLVATLACHSKTRFTSYGIPPVRFDLYNMHITVKSGQYDRFDTVIRFLAEFKRLASSLPQQQTPQIVPEKLYTRVTASLKALHIYECLRRGELKRTSALIKEYFPLHPVQQQHHQNSPNKSSTTTNTTSSNSSSKQSDLELKIIKLRTQWNEFILNKTKRDHFFRHQFHIQYDQEFLDYLFVKVGEIGDLINAQLPQTQLEQVMADSFQRSYQLLFGADNVELELEDDVRLELFLDNLQLHRHYTEQPREQLSPVTCNKYLKKIMKLLVEWECKLFNTQETLDTSMMQTYTQTNNMVIHEMLYMDSQLNDIDDQRITDENGGGDELMDSDYNITEPGSTSQQRQEQSVASTTATTEDSNGSNLLNRATVATSFTDTTSSLVTNDITRDNSKNTTSGSSGSGELTSIENCGKKPVVENELMTDDERD